MSARLVPIALALFASVACTGRGDTGQRDDTDVADTDTSADTDTGDTDYSDVEGFIVEGLALDLETNAALPQGLCIHAVDPGPVLLGLPPDFLRSAKIRADGTFALVGIETDSSLGILMLIDDCEDAAEDLYFPTATGIGKEDYTGLEDGAVIDGYVAYGITLTYRDAIDTSLATAGAEKRIGDGALTGFIATEANLDPIGGATVGCTSSSCPDVFYADADASDGLFNTATTLNASTSVAGRGLYVIPGAPIITYTVDDGGAHTFPSRLAGAFPGWAVFVSFLGE